MKPKQNNRYDWCIRISGMAQVCVELFFLESVGVARKPTARYASPHTLPFAFFSRQAHARVCVMCVCGSLISTTPKETSIQSHSKCLHISSICIRSQAFSLVVI